MDSFDWILLVIFCLFVLHGLKNTRRNEKEEREQRQRKERQSENRKYVEKSEIKRRNNVEAKRRSMPCKFKDGITYREFSAIVHWGGKQITRIKKITVQGAVVYCCVESQSGYTTWNFRLDFNDWGHLTGTYWSYTENHDSNIPEYLGTIVSEEIYQLLKERDINLPQFSVYIDRNQDLGTSSDLSYFQQKGLFDKMFSQKIVSKYDVQELVGEHLYLVISLLKDNGYKNIRSIPIKDVGRNSDKYIFEVEQVVISGDSRFEAGDVFPEGAKVLLTYHAKQEIIVPHTVNFFKKQYYIDVYARLQDLGFRNISERKIKDLVTGWIVRDGSVESVMVRTGDEEAPIQEGRAYEFDVKIVIIYHTFSKRYF